MARIATPADMQHSMSRRSKRKSARDDIAVLSPDRALTVGDRTVTVREYRLLEGMRLQAVAEPLIAQLAALAEQAESLPVEQLDAVFSQHPEAIIEMIAVACDQPAEWVAGLRGVQGETLFNTWWVVNSGFFVRRAQQRVMLRRMLASDGRAFSQPSSNTTTTRSDSPTTPNVN